MKTPKKPKTLLLNPLKHEFILDAAIDKESPDIANVCAIFNDTQNDFAVTKKEAQALGRWFLRLSEAIAK